MIAGSGSAMAYTLPHAALPLHSLSPPCLCIAFAAWLANFQFASNCSSNILTWITRPQKNVSLRVGLYRQTSETIPILGL